VEAWLQASDCRYGPVFHKIDRWGSIECAALHANALPKILARRLALAGIKASGPPLSRCWGGSIFSLGLQVGTGA